MATKQFNVSLPKAAGIFAGIAACVMLAACSGDGDSRAELRKFAGVEASPSPQPTQTIQPESTEPATPQAVLIEATSQVIEVTRETVQQVVITATPDIQGFSDAPAVNEDTQPCPKPFWQRGRCVATDAQIEAYAQGTVQP